MIARYLRALGAGAVVMAWGCALAQGQPAMPPLKPPAEPTQAVDARTVESLMHKSGLWGQLAALAQQMHGGVANAAARASEPADAKHIKLRELSAQFYSATRFQTRASQEMAAGLKASDLQSLLTWLDSPLGVRVAALEQQAAASSEDRRAAVDRRRKLVAALPPARADLLAHAVKATRVAEGMANVASSTRVAILEGADRAGLPSAADMLKRTREAVEAQRPQLVKLLSEVSLAAFADIYASLSDDELRQYIVFLESPPGARFTELSAQAIEKTLAAAAQDFGAAAAGIGMGLQ